MKTVKELQNLINEIDELRDNGRGKGDKVWSRKAARDRRFLYKVRLYLETEPREQFLHKMKADKERHVKYITSIITEKLLEDLYPKLSYLKARNAFLRDNGVPAMRDMIKTIQFILN